MDCDKVALTIKQQTKRIREALGDHVLSNGTVVGALRMLDYLAKELEAETKTDNE